MKRNSGNLRGSRGGDTPYHPPAIILGGGANALSVARNLGRMGVGVYCLDEPEMLVRYSRYCHPLHAALDREADVKAVWDHYLLNERSHELHGSVLLACSDPGIEFIAGHRLALKERFILDDSYPPAQLAMLDKFQTYQAAVAAGVPTPGFALAGDEDEMRAMGRQLSFPVIVKPCSSHVFEGVAGKKLIIATNVDEAAAAVRTITATGTRCMLVEMIPGPDDRLCSYFTYLDGESQPLFHFTKRIIRRYPALMGAACYHVTDWIPEAVELGNRLFRQVGLRGIANVEFKRDIRDGRLKLIECNARFTASDCLVAKSGFDIAAFVYNRLIGAAVPSMAYRRRSLRLWDPIRDFQAFRSLHEERKLSLGVWLASVAHGQTFAYFQWSDPLPALVRLCAPLRKRLRARSCRSATGDIDARKPCAVMHGS